MEQPVAWVAGWEQRSIQDEPLDKRRLPFHTGLFAMGVPAVVTETVADALPASSIPIDSISALHGRSYEVGEADRVTAVWEDENGNKFTSLSLKGNKFSDPGITISATAPSGYIPNGVQEDDALLRISRSSNLMRANAIDTEWMVSAVRPAFMAHGDEIVSQADYIKRMVSGVIGTVPLEEAGDVALAFEKMDFYVTARCMEINDRPFDFLDDETQDEIQARLTKIFTVYNLTHHSDEDFRELSAVIPADRVYYFTELYPKLLGRNMARMHDMGLVHKFPVPGNTTALGGIVDLDSMYGEPLKLGDKPVTIRNYMIDFAKVFDYGNRSHHAILQHIMETTDWFAATDMPYEDEFQAVHVMQSHFLASYYEASDREFTARDELLLFLAMHRGDRSVTLHREIYGQIRELLHQHDGLTHAISIELEQLLERGRQATSERLPAYVDKVIDTHSEDVGVPKDLEELKEVLAPMTMIAIGDMEAAAVHSLVNDLVEGDTSSAFDQLALELGITDEESELERAVLARAIMSPLTYFEIARKEELSSQLLTMSKSVTAAIVTTLASERKSYKMLMLRVPYRPDPDVEASEDAEQLKRYYFHGISYHVFPSVDKTTLDAAITEFSGEGQIIVHDDPDEEYALMSGLFDLPVSQIISDASELLPLKQVSTDGFYMQRYHGSDDMTYVAVVTAADPNGTVHVIVRQSQRP